MISSLTFKLDNLHKKLFKAFHESLKIYSLIVLTITSLLVFVDKTETSDTASDKAVEPNTASPKGAKAI